MIFWKQLSFLMNKEDSPRKLENYFTITTLSWRKTFFYIFFKVNFKITSNKSLKCPNSRYNLSCKLNVNQMNHFLFLKFLVTEIFLELKL